MELNQRRRKPRTLSFSLFEAPRLFNENSENIAPIIVASRQRRASVTQQNAPLIFQNSTGLDNLITEANMNASKAVAANLYQKNASTFNEGHLQNESQVSRRVSVFSTGKTPTNSTAPTRKHSTSYSQYSPIIKSSEGSNNLKERPASPVEKLKDFNENGPISCNIIREYLAYLTGIAADNGKKFRSLCSDRDSYVLIDRLSTKPALQNGIRSYSTNPNPSLRDLPYFNTLMASYPLRISPTTGSLVAFPMFHNPVRTRSSSNSSSSTNGKEVSFWFGDVFPPNTIYFDSQESDSSTSVSSLTAATRESQVDQLREAVRRLDSEYGLGNYSNHLIPDCQKRYGLSISGSATPIYRGKKPRVSDKTNNMTDELSIRLSEIAPASSVHGFGCRMPDLTQVYGPLPHPRSFREVSSVSNTRGEGEDSTRVRAAQLLAAASSPISQSSPLARRSMSKVSGLDQMATLNTSSSFTCGDNVTNSSLLAAIDKRIKAQEANMIAPVYF